MRKSWTFHFLLLREFYNFTWGFKKKNPKSINAHFLYLLLSSMASIIMPGCEFNLDSGLMLWFTASNYMWSDLQLLQYTAMLIVTFAQKHFIFSCMVI